MPLLPSLVVLYTFYKYITVGVEYCLSVAGFYQSLRIGRLSSTLLVMHIGDLIRRKVAEKGISVVSFAEQLSCTRINVYKMFNRQSLDTELLLRVSKVLEFDFFSCYSERLNRLPGNNTTTSV